VRRRAKELGVHLVYEGVSDKLATYREVKRRLGLKDYQIAYVGDDVIDLPILRQAGFAVSVRDGWEGLRGVVDYVTSASGGQGAVREVAELLLKTQGRWTTRGR
jgi:3-deoxy-D-manno-octulosonate 8-phosphate phosphatase (KDO 8-P phosphatase)